jgi:AcrR family transcriptional regulator
MSRATAATLLGPESRDKEARMRAMLDGAIELFAEEGYSAVSTRRIAEAAGCSETLLFRYFGGKRGLLIAICQDWGGQAEAPQPKAEDFQDLAAFVESYLLRMFSEMKQQAARLKVITSAIIGDAELSSEFEAMHDMAVERLAADLRQFQDRGQIAADVDLTSTAAAIEQAGYSVGLFMQIVYGKPERELRALAQSFSRAMAHGMQAAAEEATADSWRQEAIQAAHDATQELGRIVGLLKSGDAAVRRAGGRGSGRAKA